MSHAAMTPTTSCRTRHHIENDPAFQEALIENIGALRIYARTLTRNITEADDLVQECLLKALEKNHLWERGTNLRAWLLVILRNLFINRYRRGRSRPEHVSFEDRYHDRPESDLPADERPTMKQIERAVHALPAEQREVVILIPMQGFSYEEVATITNVPLGTVRSRLARARMALRRILGAHTFIEQPSGFALERQKAA